MERPLLTSKNEGADDEIAHLAELLKRLRKLLPELSEGLQALALKDLKEFRRRLEGILEKSAVDMTEISLVEIQDLGKTLNTSIESLPLSANDIQKKRMMTCLRRRRISVVGHIVHFDESTNKIRVGVYKKMWRQSKPGPSASLEKIQTTHKHTEVEVTEFRSLTSISGIGPNHEAMILDVLSKLLPLDRELTEDEKASLKQFREENGIFIIQD